MLKINNDPQSINDTEMNTVLMEFLFLACYILAASFLAHLLFVVTKAHRDVFMEMATLLSFALSAPVDHSKLNSDGKLSIFQCSVL